MADFPHLKSLKCKARGQPYTKTAARQEFVFAKDLYSDKEKMAPCLPYCGGMLESVATSREEDISEPIAHAQEKLSPLQGRLGDGLRCSRVIVTA